MKAECSGARCPFCGAPDFVLEDNDIFCCEYCGAKFSFDLDGLAADGEKVAAQELYAIFNAKKSELEEQKNREKRFVKYFSAKAAASAAGGVSALIALAAAASFFAAFVFPYLFIAAAAGIVLFTLLTVYRKKMYKKYHPVAMFYASRAAKYDEQISVYAKLLSKLIK